MSKVLFPEGTVFFVPLTTTGYARGVVARSSRRILFGYFFGPRMEACEECQMEDLVPDAAILRTMVGDLGLVEGGWRTIGQLPRWNREQWPVPDFVRHDPLGRLKSKIIRYSDTDLSQIEIRDAVGDELNLLRDGLSGSSYVEIKLTQLLDKNL